MIKTYFIGIIMSFISLGSFSQTSYIDIILNMPTTNFNYGKSNKTLKDFKKGIWGIQVGASVQTGITKKFSIVSELYFIMKGGKLKENNSLTLNKSIIRLYVIELPVLARFHFNRFFLNAGPYIAYTVFGKIKTEGSDAIPESNTNLSFDHSKQAFKHWESGVQFGGGYMFPFKKMRMAVDLRYSYGLTNISNDTERHNSLFNVNLFISKPCKEKIIKSVY